MITVRLLTHSPAKTIGRTLDVLSQCVLPPAGSRETIWLLPTESSRADMQSALCRLGG